MSLFDGNNIKLHIPKEIYFGLRRYALSEKSNVKSDNVKNLIEWNTIGIEILRNELNRGNYLENIE